MRTRAVTPVWVKLLLVAVLVGGVGWWAAQRHDRIVNEARLSAIATGIAGREVRVRCPGALGRLLAPGAVAGTVRFDAAGRPADEAELREFACAELDALAEGRREAALACAERGGTRCGRAAADAALAVNVLAHEAWHLAGIVDEAVTECRAVQTNAAVAAQLGATPARARALAVTYLATDHPRLPARYRSPACADGEALDLRPDDPVWP